MEEGGVNPWTRHQTPLLQQQGQGQSADAFSFGGTGVDGETSAGQGHGSRVSDEEDICRVCRGEATPDQPLMHPWYILRRDEVTNEQ
jgi:hypothetical protein